MSGKALAAGTCAKPAASALPLTFKKRGLAIVTKAANLNKHIDTNIVLLGKLQGNEQPSVLGVHLSLDDFECEEMFGEQVECHGKLRRKKSPVQRPGETHFVLERLVKISVIK